MLTVTRAYNTEAGARIGCRLHRRDKAIRVFSVVARIYGLDHCRGTPTTFAPMLDATERATRAPCAAENYRAGRSASPNFCTYQLMVLGMQGGTL